jgi:hypothetical protein
VSRSSVVMTTIHRQYHVALIVIMAILLSVVLGFTLANVKVRGKDYSCPSMKPVMEKS